MQSILQEQLDTYRSARKSQIAADTVSQGKQSMVLGVRDADRFSVVQTEHHFQEQEENKTNHDMNSERLDLDKATKNLSIQNFNSFINNEALDQINEVAPSPNTQT